MTSESITEALISVLRGVPALSALVGMRIWPGEIPQKPLANNPHYPAIVYHEISGSSQKHLGGISGFAEKRLQFDCHAATATQAEDIRQLVRLALQPLRDNIGDVFVMNVEADDERSDTSPHRDGSDKRIQIKMIDFVVQYSQPVALGA